MARITITNLTAEPLLLQELYTTVAPGGSITTDRFHDDLHSVPRLQQLWYDNKISVSLVTTTPEGDFITQKVRHDGSGGGPGGPVDLNATSVKHVEIKTATTLVHGAGSLTPDVVYAGNLVYLEFNHTTDLGFAVYKVGRDFASNPNIHVHWTKSQDANESGNTARWRIGYTVYTSTPSTAGNAATTGVFVDTGTLTYVGGDANTDRLVYRTADMPLVGITAGQYITIKVTAPIPASGTPVTNPGLVSVDLTYSAFINKPT